MYQCDSDEFGPESTDFICDLDGASNKVREDDVNTSFLTFALSLATLANLALVRVSILLLSRRLLIYVKFLRAPDSFIWVVPHVVSSKRG